MLGTAFGACGYTCNLDQYYNIDEFTVGAGVCEPEEKKKALPRVAELSATAPPEVG